MGLNHRHGDDHMGFNMAECDKNTIRNERGTYDIPVQYLGFITGISDHGLEKASAGLEKVFRLEWYSETQHIQATKMRKKPVAMGIYGNAISDLRQCSSACVMIQMRGELSFFIRIA